MTERWLQDWASVVVWSQSVWWLKRNLWRNSCWTDIYSEEFWRTSAFNLGSCSSLKCGSFHTHEQISWSHFKRSTGISCKTLAAYQKRKRKQQKTVSVCGHCYVACESDFLWPKFKKPLDILVVAWSAGTHKGDRRQCLEGCLKVRSYLSTWVCKSSFRGPKCFVCFPLKCAGSLTALIWKGRCLSVLSSPIPSSSFESPVCADRIKHLCIQVSCTTCSTRCSHRHKSLIRCF